VSRRELAFLVGIVLAGALLRFLTLGHQSYDHDESVTVAKVLQPGLRPTLGAINNGERSPPLYYLLAWIWSKPFGTGEVGLRALSALIGTLVIPAAYAVARQFASHRAGLVAAALVATNPYLIWYSQTARSYELLVLFTTVALFFFVRALRERDRHSLALWAAASGLALCSHYFAFFLIAPQALWLLATARGNRRTAAAVVAVAAVGLALAPLAIHQQGGGKRDAFTRIPLAERGADTLSRFVASEMPAGVQGTATTNGIQLAAAVALGLLALLAMAQIRTRCEEEERRGALAVGLVGLAAFAAPFALAIVGPDFVDPRNLIGSVVPLLVVAAVGFGGARVGRTGLVAAVASCVVFLGIYVAVYESPAMQRVDWRGAAAAIGPAGSPRIIVGPRDADWPFVHYLGALFLTTTNEPRQGVREIDVLSKDSRIRPPGGDFRLVSRRRLSPTFTLWAFRSKRPVYVPLDSLSGRRVLNEDSSVMVQPS
jgi:mannosyltransferase